MGLPTFPGMSYELTHSAKKTVKGAVLMPRANNQKMGIFSMAILDTTLEERPPGSDDPPQVNPTLYVTAAKSLYKKGCWPNKCEGHALQDKLLNYVGDMALYSAANRKRKSYYATSTPPEDIITICKSRMTCITGGKYRELQTFGAGAMINFSLPDSVTKEAYKLVNYIKHGKNIQIGRKHPGTSIGMVRKTNLRALHRLRRRSSGSLHESREVTEKHNNRRVLLRFPHVTPHEG